MQYTSRFCSCTLKKKEDNYVVVQLRFNILNVIEIISYDWYILVYHYVWIWVKNWKYVIIYMYTYKCHTDENNLCTVNLHIVIVIRLTINWKLWHWWTIGCCNLPTIDVGYLVIWGWYAWSWVHFTVILYLLPVFGSVQNV